MSDDDENAGPWEYPAPSGRSREQEVLERMMSDPNELRRRIWFAVGQAEIALGLAHDDARSAGETLDRILAAALAGRLDPGLYSLCWQLRRIASWEPPAESEKPSNGAPLAGD
jgi:hypothetical protein